MSNLPFCFAKATEFSNLTMELCSSLWTMDKESLYPPLLSPSLSLIFSLCLIEKTGTFKLCYFTHPLLISCQGRILGRKSTLWQNTGLKNFGVIPAGRLSCLGTGPTISDAHFSTGLFIDKRTTLAEHQPGSRVYLITELCYSSHFKHGSDYKKWRAEIMIAIPFIMNQVQALWFCLTSRD